MTAGDYRVVESKGKLRRVYGRCQRCGRLIFGARSRCTMPSHSGWAPHHVDCHPPVGGFGIIPDSR